MLSTCNDDCEVPQGKAVKLANASGVIVVGAEQPWRWVHDLYIVEDGAEKAHGHGLHLASSGRDKHPFAFGVLPVESKEAVKGFAVIECAGLDVVRRSQINPVDPGNRFCAPPILGTRRDAVYEGAARWR